MDYANNGEEAEGEEEAAEEILDHDEKEGDEEDAGESKDMQDMLQ